MATRLDSPAALPSAARRSGPTPGISQGPPVDVASLLGVGLTAAFQTAELTVRAAADELGTGRQTVRRWMQGHRVGAQYAPGLLRLLGRHDLAVELNVARAGKVRCPGYTDSVRDRLAELNMSNADLVAATGMSRTSLYAWLAGQSSLSGDNLARVCGALRWPASRLDRQANIPAAPGVTWQARLERRMSRRRLASAAGITEPTLRRIEAGGEASAVQLVKVADALGLDEAARTALLTQRRRPRPSAAGPAGSWDDPAPVTVLGLWVEEAAAQRGWSRTDVARHLDVTRQALNLWMTGSARIADPAVLSRVAVLVNRTAGEVTAAMSSTPHPWALAGDRLRVARKERNLSQRELAGRIGVNSTQLASWESGATRPSVRHRQALTAWVTHSGHRITEATASWFAETLSSSSSTRLAAQSVPQPLHRRGQGVDGRGGIGERPLRLR